MTYKFQNGKLRADEFRVPEMNGFKFYIHYNHGNFLWVIKDVPDKWPNGKEKPIHFIFQIDEHVGVDYKKVFSPRNVARFWWWKIKQRLFWHNVHKPIGEFLRKHTALNKVPYPIQRL